MEGGFRPPAELQALWFVIPQRSGGNSIRVLHSCIVGSAHIATSD
jgi:hypothetical protein